MYVNVECVRQEVHVRFKRNESSAEETKEIKAKQRKNKTNERIRRKINKHKNKFSLIRIFTLEHLLLLFVTDSLIFRLEEIWIWRWLRNIMFEMCERYLRSIEQNHLINYNNFMIWDNRCVHAMNMWTTIANFRWGKIQREWNWT